MWLEFFGGLFLMSKSVISERKCDNKEGDLNRAHPFSRVRRYKRGSDITCDNLHSCRIKISIHS